MVWNTVLCSLLISALAAMMSLTSSRSRLSSRSVTFSAMRMSSRASSANVAVSDAGMTLFG